MFYICSIMDPALTLTVADLALDDMVRLRCDCRARAYSRAELGVLVGLDARLHLIGLRLAMIKLMARRSACSSTSWTGTER
jgi:hypothetical protein